MSLLRRPHTAGALLACLMGYSLCAQAAILTVDPEGGQDFTTIQQAFDVAAEGDVIELADGVYVGEGNHHVEFYRKTVTLRSANGPAHCIVDCEGTFLGGGLSRATLKGLTFVDTVLDIQADMRIEDCIFTTTADDGRMPTLSICRCRPVIVNCTFTDMVNNDGGAIHCDEAAPTIRGCTFTGNVASDDGGAICNRDHSSPTIVGCRFVDNSCADDGGAIANYENSHPLIVACTFEGNQSNDNGGAIFSRSDSRPMIVSCFFAGNHARSNGGAIYSRENIASFVNCVFTGNSAHDSGGALYCTQTSGGPMLLNCTLVGNTAGLEGGAIRYEQSGVVELLNCIVWDNQDEAGDSEASQISAVYRSLRHSCLQHWSGQWEGTANHGQDPLFVDTDGPDDIPGTADDDLRLTAGSPCIDTGLNAPLSDPFLTDCDGYPRLAGPLVDQGAYEYAGPQGERVLLDLAAESIVINEAVTHSSGPHDWVELHNVTDRSIHIGGWWLSDRERQPFAYEIAPGTTIEPHGFLVLHEDEHFGNPNDPGSYRTFALNANGEDLVLHSGYGGLLTGYRQEQYLERAGTAQSLGRHINSIGTVDFVKLAVATPGQPNGAPQIGPVVISEIMYNPPSGDHGEQYVELHNITDATINMRGWEYRGLSCFDTEDMVWIPAQGRLLIAIDPDTLRASYGPLPADVPVVHCRPWLDKDYDTLDLRDRWGLVERVSYSNGSHPLDFAAGVDPWPTEADGQGAALTRIEPAAYGNEPANWQAAPPSPGW